MSIESAIESVMDLIKSHHVKAIDLRFTDTRGKEQHITVPVSIIDADVFHQGKMFDGSSIDGWKKINDSDMMLLPDPTAAIIDPFCKQPTLNIRCDVYDPFTRVGYERCPRSIAKRAEKYMRSTGIADTCYFGPEPEFFIFDDVRWDNSMAGCFYAIDAEEASWNSKKVYEAGNKGHRPGVKGGYFPVPPVDSAHEIRQAMCDALEKMGMFFEAHHHEVATAGQNEISTNLNSLVKKADDMQDFKYVVHNVANAYGKTATFMPKPLVGDNGNGMHCHQSLAKNGRNLFTGDKYAGLSELALYYIGGIIKHARAINALTNSTTNSYKRLVPGFEAPTMLAYSSCNRSAAIRVPYSSPQARRIEVRFPDPASNPYLAFAAMTMAGLDGIQNKILPGDPVDRDLYELTEEETRDIPKVCSTLQQALESLDQDRDFLIAGGVFTNDMLNAYIELKKKEILRLQMSTHPVEFEMYYSV